MGLQTPVMAAEEGSTIKIVALGDSLTAGYGLNLSDAFPTVLTKALQDKGYNVEVMNAGVSGDTTQGGLERLAWSVPDGTDGVILELGANDMLRGISPTITRQNLETIIQTLNQRKIKVLLTGMASAPNLGKDYAEQFGAIFPDLSKEYKLILYPFFLDGVAGNISLNQPDGMHPTAEGVNVIVTNILPTVEAFVARIKAAKR
ncbi:arylesterase [Microvirga sp. W0021]|uniref:Arylesterase n=2 Tax=Hohaiivirga grylli TaxID=3133970 RepID=A0ABV0BGT8_9HYPH